MSVGMRRAFEFGERVGLALSLVLWIAWVAGGAAAAWQIPKLAVPPRLAIAVVVLIAVITGIGGLIWFWVIAGLVDFRRLGYRVKFVAGSEWVYEKHHCDGSVRSFQFTRHQTGDGYPAPCEVPIPCDALWLDMMPDWARHRRSEIMERIAHCLGAGAGGQVQFVELTGYSATMITSEA